MGGKYFNNFFITKRVEGLLQNAAAFFYYKTRQKFITKRVRSFITKRVVFITKRGSYYKTSRFYYKTRQVLQNEPLLQNEAQQQRTTIN